MIKDALLTNQARYQRGFTLGATCVGWGYNRIWIAKRAQPIGSICLPSQFNGLGCNIYFSWKRCNFESIKKISTYLTQPIGYGGQCGLTREVTYF